MSDNIESQPSFDELRRLAEVNKVLQVFQSQVLDPDDVLKIYTYFQNRKDFVFLESVSEHKHRDRYSYMALSSYKKFSYQQSTQANEDVFEGIKACLSIYKNKEEQLPFACGLLGYIDYEAVAQIESIPMPDKKTLGRPLAQLMLPRTMLVIDNMTQTLYFVYNIFVEENKSLRNAENKAALEIKMLQKDYEQAIKMNLTKFNEVEKDPESPQCESNISKATFIKRVNIAKDYIKAGDIFQVQISRRVKSKLKSSPDLLYRYLRHYNPSPFLFHVKFDKQHVLGASPELLVGVNNKQMIIRPLAGTRKRHSSKQSEVEIIAELKADPKERAEHIMLVDLARHEIGQACKAGSVKVLELLEIEKYSHVIHMVSEVVGELKENQIAVDALKYGFPAGTVSGAPKIRAMEIISELEDEQRQFYSGAVVFFDCMGNLKSTITIRSMAIEDNMVYAHAAAGVVADSDPELEYQETENKLRICLRAMQAEAINS
eukprot:COSAG01_NODE_740_length_13891_cov_35.573013_12_plen_488_part_00